MRCDLLLTFDCLFLCRFLFCLEKKKTEVVLFLFFFFFRFPPRDFLFRIFVNYALCLFFFFLGLSSPFFHSVRKSISKKGASISFFFFFA